MRVLVATDSFGGTLSAVEAADAVAAGWRETAPRDRVDVVPLSDGGPGFVEVLAASGGTTRALTVAGPLGTPVAATWLLRDGTAYVESAQACGLHLVPPAARDPRRTTTLGVGELVVAAAAAGSGEVVVGLGGSATNDGGAGLWAALGARPCDELAAGGGGLAGLAGVQPPAEAPGRLVAATDVDTVLLGPNGASAVFGPQKGADRAAVLDLDDALRRWADLVEPVTGRPGLRDAPGAGAAGGLGFGLFALGARRAAGFGLVAEAVGLAGRLAEVDLVVTGEGAFDATSLHGKVVAGVAGLAQEAGVPCLVLAGRVEVGRRDAAAAGVDAAYAVADLLGSPAEALAAGAEGVTRLAARTAREWSHGGSAP